MLKQKIVLAILLTLSLTGCSTTAVYVLQDSELMRVKQGQAVTAKQDGWYLSDKAVDRIMNARIERTKLQ